MPLFADAALVSPSPGLMIWTLVVFFITFYLLKRLAFGRIAEAIDERRRIVRENLESAERSRDEAQGLLEEYKQQLAEARQEAADDRRARPAHRRGALEADARGGRRAQRERDLRRRPRPPIAGRDAPGARPDQERGRRPHPAGHREGRRARARRGRAAPLIERGARRGRLHAASPERTASPWRATRPAPSTASALYEAAEDAGHLKQVAAATCNDLGSALAENAAAGARAVQPGVPAARQEGNPREAHARGRRARRPRAVLVLVDHGRLDELPEADRRRSTSATQQAAARARGRAHDRHPDRRRRRPTSCAAGSPGRPARRSSR